MSPIISNLATQRERNRRDEWLFFEVDAAVGLSSAMLFRALLASGPINMPRLMAVGRTRQNLAINQSAPPA
jgi:hypothetical protein